MHNLKEFLCDPCTSTRFCFVLFSGWMKKNTVTEEDIIGSSLLRESQGKRCQKVKNFFGLHHGGVTLSFILPSCFFSATG